MIISATQVKYPPRQEQRSDALPESVGIGVRPPPPAPPLLNRLVAGLVASCFYLFYFFLPRLLLSGFWTGSGQTGFSQMGYKSPIYFAMCKLPYFATCYMLPHFDHMSP